MISNCRSKTILTLTANPLFSVQWSTHVVIQLRNVSWELSVPCVAIIFKYGIITTGLKVRTFRWMWLVLYAYRTLHKILPSRVCSCWNLWYHNSWNSYTLKFVVDTDSWRSWPLAVHWVDWWPDYSKFGSKWYTYQPSKNNIILYK